jgi:NTP pyrophosphatase (non-canonical NTP hydrolase)
MYKIIEEATNQDDNRIEETFESKRTFTIGELKEEIEMYDNEITDLQKRKKELEDKINAVNLIIKK